VCVRVRVRAHVYGVCVHVSVCVCLCQYVWMCTIVCVQACACVIAPEVQGNIACLVHDDAFASRGHIVNDMVYRLPLLLTLETR